MSDGLIRELFKVLKQLSVCKQERSENEDKFRALVEPWAQAVWEANPEGMTVSDSPTWRAFTGQTKEALMSAHGWENVVHPDDRETAGQRWMEAVRRKTPMDAVFRLRRWDGSWRWTNVRAAPLLARNGSVKKWVGMNIDIHDRKLAKDALKESEAQFRQLADAMPQLVWTAGPDGTVTYVNKRRSEYENIPAGDNGIDWRVLLHEEDRERTVTIWRHALEIGDTYQVEHRLRLADGTYHWHLSRAMPVRDSEGNIVKWFGTATDIENIKQVEAALHQLNATLEQQVAERTELAEARAKQLQRLAVELVQAEESERRRIADLLHDDLQQLIASARMQVQSAFGKADPGPMLENVEQLLADSLEKSRRLSHELSPPVLHQFGLPAALEWLVRHMNEKFGLKIRLETAITHELTDTSFKVFLFRAAQELLFNVVKHSGVNKADLRLYDSDNRIALSVRDQGMGIARHILDSFETRSGLGLVSLRERAAAIGGKLEIDSQPGKGSLFILTVPISLADADKDEKRIRVNVSPSGRSDRQKKMSDSEIIRVLFVDDHKVMRQGLVRMIAEQPGIRVAGEAASGEEAMVLAGRLRPDVVLMDISMPGMGGMEATRRIKAEMPEIRVIGLSMFADENISLKMRQAGADGFVSKSESSSALLKTIYDIAGSHND
jgi:PAS domain S-box-containing protein